MSPRGGAIGSCIFVIYTFGFAFERLKRIGSKRNEPGMKRKFLIPMLLLQLLVMHDDVAAVLLMLMLMLWMP